MKKKISIKQKLRDILKKDILYTTGDLLTLVGHEKEATVRQALSELQNNHYCGPGGVTKLVQVRGADMVKRWGTEKALVKGETF